MCRVGVWAAARRSQARSSVGGRGMRLRVVLRLQLRDLESLPGFQDGRGCDGKGATLKERLVAAFLPGASQSAASILTKHRASGRGIPQLSRAGPQKLLVLGCEIGSRVRSTLPACPACGYQRSAWTTMAGCPATGPERRPLAVSLGGPKPGPHVAAGEISHSSAFRGLRTPSCRLKIRRKKKAVSPPRPNSKKNVPARTNKKT